MSEYFKLPPYNDDQPLVEHPLYKWLTDNVDPKEGGHSKIIDWIKTLGFCAGEDKLSPHDVDTLRWVEDYWWRYSPRYKPQHAKDLFTEPRGDEGSAFLFCGPFFNDFRGITHKLQTMVVEAGWIYNVHPSMTYFEVIEGRLYARYLQIIGSRYICDIIDHKEQ